jgi:type IV pilus assembly protein PilM
MLTALWKNRRWPLGLDIGTDSIKMLQLQRVGQVLSVSACGLHRLPRAAAEGGAERRKAVLAGIREIMDKGHFHGRRVISALSSSQLSIKNVRMPEMPEDQLAAAIREEASERFGFEVGADQLRWIEAGTVRQGTEVRQEIIMLAAPSETIEDHLSLLDEAGLVPEHIEAEPVSIFRVFQHFLRRRGDEEAVSVVADIGRSATRVTVARGHRIVFIKRIDIAGRALTDGVAKQLNLSHDEAYDLRVRIMKEQSEPRSRRAEQRQQDAADAERRTSVDWTIHDAMRGCVEELAREIALCLRYCSVTFRGLRSECVVLTGGEAYDPALVDLLSENLGVGCEVGRPLRGVDVGSMNVGSNRRGTLAEWGVCAGLALRAFDADNIASENDDAEHRLSA